MAIGLVVTSLAGVAAAETVKWQAAVVAGADGRRVLVNGVRTYTPDRDVVVREHRNFDDVVAWSKSLQLSGTLSVATSVRRLRRVDGFGLAVYQRGDLNGFSWNWFERGRDGVFQRRRRPGRVSVVVRRDDGYEELEAVEFLDDVTLLYLDDVRRAPGKHSHEVVIRRGSVLKFAGTAEPEPAVTPAALPATCELRPR
jgi:hypothetical protein